MSLDYGVTDEKVDPLFVESSKFTRGRLIASGARPFPDGFSSELYLDRDGRRAVYEVCNPSGDNNNFRTRYSIRNVVSLV